MIFLLILLSTIIPLGNCSVPPPKCPPNMIQSNTNPTICYLFVNNASSFDDAEKFCNRSNGHLAPVLNALANFFIIDNAITAFKNADSYWIGGRSSEVNDAAVWLWTWQDSIVRYSDWAPGQPNKNACISSAIQTALWSSEDCTVAKPFVCQIPAIVDICDPGWTYFKSSSNNTQYPDGMCYRYMSQAGITFDQAQNVCQTQNANLVSIHSEEENTFLSNLTKYGTPETWPAQAVYIGLHYVDFRWRWLDGTDVIYDNWGPDRPLDQTNNVLARLYPDVIIQGQQWTQKWDNAASVTILNRFICKKKPGFVSVTEKLL